MSLACGRAERAPGGGQNVEAARDRIFRWFVTDLQNSSSSGARCKLMSFHLSGIEAIRRGRLPIGRAQRGRLQPAPQSSRSRTQGVGLRADALSLDICGLGAIVRHARSVNLTARGSQLGGRLLSPYSQTLFEWPTVRTQRKRRGLTGTGSPLGDAKESIGARVDGRINQSGLSVIYYL